MYGPSGCHQLIQELRFSWRKEGMLCRDDPVSKKQFRRHRNSWVLFGSMGRVSGRKEVVFWCLTSNSLVPPTSASHSTSSGFASLSQNNKRAPATGLKEKEVSSEVIQPACRSEADLVHFCCVFLGLQNTPSAFHLEKRNENNLLYLFKTLNF